MKRDMDLIRRILLDMEESENAMDAGVFVDDQHDYQAVSYNIDIMEQAGLIKASIVRADGGIYYSVRVKSITWDGQDFLATIKSEKIWTKVKTKVSQKLGDASLDMIKSLAVKLGTDLLLG